MTIKSVWFRLRPSLVKSALVFAGLSLGLLTLTASEKPHFESKGLDGAITVDGKFDDWYGNLQPFGSDPVSIQFLNDGQFLYVRVTASDSATRMQIMRMGMTVWFDSGGGTKKKFGIRYPSSSTVKGLTTVVAPGWRWRLRWLRRRAGASRRRPAPRNRIRRPTASASSVRVRRCAQPDEDHLSAWTWRFAPTGARCNAS